MVLAAQGVLDGSGSGSQNRVLDVAGLPGNSQAVSVASLWNKMDVCMHHLLYKNGIYHDKEGNVANCYLVGKTTVVLENIVNRHLLWVERAHHFDAHAQCLLMETGAAFVHMNGMLRGNY